jgi:hypothetical protein
MAAELAKTGLRGKELENALDDAASKAAEAQFGPEWAKQVNSLDKQAELFKSHMSQLFRLKTDDLQAGLGRLIGLFDETSVTGKAIKSVFDSLMQPLIDGLVGLVPVIEKTFIQFEIWALRALISIKPYGSTIAAVAKGLAVVAGIIIGVLVVALAAAVAVGAAFLTIVSTVWRVIIDWGQSMVAAGQAAWAFGGAIMSGAGAAFDWLASKVNGAINWLRSLSLAEIGQAMIDGLIAGITGGAGGILGSITNVVGGAIDGAKKLLQINSPSKVFASIGASTGEGMVDGVQGATADVQASVEKMVEPPKAAAIEPPAVAAKATPAVAQATQDAASVAAASPVATVAASPAVAAPAAASPVSVNVAAPALEKSATPAAPTLEQIAPAPTAPTQAAAPLSAKSGGNTFNFTINAPDGESKSLAAEIRKAFDDLIEGDAAQIGGAVPA